MGEVGIDYFIFGEFYFEPDCAHLDPDTGCLDDTPPEDLGSPDDCKGVGDPCNAATGNTYRQATDYDSPAGLSFTRHYSSLQKKDIGLGVGWSAPMLRGIDLFGDSALLWHRDGGGEVIENVDGQWRAEADSTLDIIETADGFTVTARDGSASRYDGGGRLVAESDAYGRETTYTYNPAGQLASLTGPDGHRLEFTYTADGHLETLTDPAGQLYTYSYDMRDNLTAVTYPDGGTVTYHYEDPSVDTSGLPLYPHHLTAVVDEAGITVATYAYDTEGRATYTSHAVDDSGEAMDAYTLAYDSPTQTTVTGPHGEVEVFEFEAKLGRKNTLRKTLQADGKGIEREYDAQNNLIATTNAEGERTTYTYNAANQRTSRTDAAGTALARTTHYEYLSPERDLVTRERRPSVLAGHEAETLTDYDTHGNPVRITERGYAPDGSAIERVTTLRYDTAGRLIERDGPRTDVADITTYSYYSCTGGGHCGRLASTTNALGHTTTFDNYDAHGRLRQRTDPNGLVTEYHYDSRGRLITQTETAPDGTTRTTTLTYGPAGRLLRTESPGGRSLDYHYDSAGRLEAVSDAAGARIEYSYDAEGRRTARRVRGADATLLREATYTYDLRDNLATVSRGGQSHTELHDALGRLLRRTDGNGHATEYHYDALGRRTRVDGPAADMTTTYAYNARGDIVRVTAPNGAETTYDLDDFGQRRSRHSPDTGTTTYTYDAAGNRTRETDARGVQTTYAYDAAGRLSAVTYPDPARDISYTYDRGPGGLGRLTGMSDSAGTSTYSYDAFGHLTEHTRSTDDGLTFTTAYRYDGAGRLTDLTYPSGLTVHTTYGTDGQVTDLSLRDEAAARQWPLLGAIDHAPFGGPRTWTHANGLATTRTRDLAGRLAHQDVGALWLTDYTYDGAGNLTAIDTPNAPAQRQAFAYDPADRLTEASGPYPGQQFSYDASGNRLSLTEDGSTVGYTYAPASNRLLGLGAAPTRQYDAAGNTLASTAGSFGYDARGRLVAANDALYDYNGKGERVTKTTPTATTHFHYDPDGQLLAESDAAGNVLIEYVYLEGLPVAAYTPQALSGGDSAPPGAGCEGTDATLTGILVPAGTTFTCSATDTLTTSTDGFTVEAGASAELRATAVTLRPGFHAQPGSTFRAAPPAPEPASASGIYYLHPDHLGTVRRITDQAGTVIWRWDSKPFGESAPVEDPDGDGVAFTFNLRFPGQRYDAETGLHYNYFRDYEPGTGRYIESDPIGLEGGVNTYVYARQNPLRTEDRLGLYGSPKFCVDPRGRSVPCPRDVCANANCGAGLPPIPKPDPCANCRASCIFGFLNPIPGIAADIGADAAGRQIGGIAGAIAADAFKKLNKVNGAYHLGTCLGQCQDICNDSNCQ